MPSDPCVKSKMYDGLLAPKGEVSQYLAFDPSKPSRGQLFTDVLLLTRVSREPMSQNEKITK